MADFRTKLITLAGAATMFASMAFGQLTYGPSNLSTTGAIFIRAEGTTEMLPQTTLQLQQPAGAAQASVTITIYLSPTVAITSQVVNKNSETLATPAGGTAVNGVVTGSQVQFTGVVIPANGTGSAVNTNVTIANIRVNASTLASSSGIPQGVAEQAFISGVTGVTPGPSSSISVAYVQNGLAAATESGTTTNTICGGAAITTTNFVVTVADAFSSAFKTQIDEQNGSIDPVNSGTRFTVTFGNVPANTQLYVPLSVIASSTAKIQLIASATAATAGTNLVADAAVKNETQGLGAVAISSGSGTAIYEVTTDTLGAVATFPINVYLVNTAGSLTAPASAITATVSLAPIGSSATATYPNFVSGSSTTTVSGSTFIACSTTLLFPFVTNQLGFDTGFAISNTSTDTLGSKSGDSVSAQSGTCTLNFFGASAPTTAPVTSSVATGTTYTNAASVIAPGFQGYLIANCNFQYAHGFAFVWYAPETNTGAAMGYLGLVLNSSRSGSLPESLNN
jgi:hypothetical protein